MRVRDERLWRHPQSITIYHDTIATGTTFGQIRIDRTFGDEPFTHHDIRQEFRQRYVNADGQLNKTTQTAYLLALRFGLLPEEHRVAARDSLRLKSFNRLCRNGVVVSCAFRRGYGRSFLCFAASATESIVAL